MRRARNLPRAPGLTCHAWPCIAKCGNQPATYAGAHLPRVAVWNLAFFTLFLLLEGYCFSICFLGDCSFFSALPSLFFPTLMFDRFVSVCCSFLLSPEGSQNRFCNTFFRLLILGFDFDIAIASEELQHECDMVKTNSNKILCNIFYFLRVGTVTPTMRFEPSRQKITKYQLHPNSLFAMSWNMIQVQWLELPNNVWKYPSCTEFHAKCI